jgi:hypothetical protein
MYGLKPVPFTLKPVPFKLKPVPFKLKPVPFTLKPVPFKLTYYCISPSLYIGTENVLCSSQREFHAHPYLDACAGLQALVAIACAQHLPAEASARAAHAHST